jgi:hypothetical protein
MKPIILSVLFLSLISISHAQVTDWKQLELKGKVKSLKAQETYRYKPAGKWTEWEKTYGRNYLFNNSGRKTEYHEFKADGTSGYKILYSYNLKEKKADVSYFGKDDKPTIKKTHILDAKGNMMEEIEYTREGTLDRRYAYTYDEKGNMTSMTGFKADGKMSSKTTWIYDSKGKLTDWTLETPGYATSYKKFVHDEKGNMKEEIWYNGNKEITFRFVRSYDAQGNKIEELKYKDGDKLLDMSKWRYEYDKTGNWTKRTQSTSDGADFHIEERTISYF